MGQTLLAAGNGPSVPVLAATVARSDLRSLVLILLASTLGALLARLHRRIVLPTVVLEIVLGIVIGPQVLGIADLNAYVTILADFGLGFLFFVAGIEVIEVRVARRLVVHGTVGWGIARWRLRWRAAGARAGGP